MGEILQGDSLQVLQTLPEDSCDMVCTSPPYWGLRDYGVDGMVGLEDTPEQWCQRLVAVFAEVRRVLKPWGTLWLNCGDAYASNTAPGGNSGVPIEWQRASRGEAMKGRAKMSQGLKPKDLIGLPWRLAFALQADGWWLRSDIIWAKPNPMPESVTDRPTSAHEHVFLLAPSAKYFYDAEAVSEASTYGEHHAKYQGTYRRHKIEALQQAGATNGLQYQKGLQASAKSPHTRNLRNVWTIATQPFPEAHFATYPEALVRPCIKAGTSQRGNCAECGKPWVRVVEKGERVNVLNTNQSPVQVNGTDDKDAWSQPGGKADRVMPGHAFETTTTGWRKQCECSTDETTRPVVLDPFAGACTTALVASKLNRDYLMIELNPEYCEMGRKRLYDAVPLFT